MRRSHLIAVFVGLIPCAAFAQGGDNWSVCSSGAKIEETITACTAVIDSGAESGERLAHAYYERGFNESLKASYATDRAAMDAQAIADLSKTIETEPNNKDALGLRAQVYYFESRYSEAIPDLERVEQIDPGRDIADSLAHSYEHTGQPQKALAAFTSVVKHRPKEANSYAERGNFYGRNNQPALAIADYNTAIKLDAKDGVSSYTADLYYRRGLAKQAKGDAVGGTADIAKANKMYPGTQAPNKDD